MGVRACVRACSHGSLCHFQARLLYHIVFSLSCLSCATPLSLSAVAGGRASLRLQPLQQTQYTQPIAGKPHKAPAHDAAATQGNPSLEYPGGRGIAYSRAFAQAGICADYCNREFRCVELPCESDCETPAAHRGSLPIASNRARKCSLAYCARCRAPAMRS